jgi:hypothetical protein
VAPRHAVHEIDTALEMKEGVDDVELVAFHRRVEEFAPVLPRRLDDDVHRDRHKMMHYEICSCEGYPPCRDIRSMFPNTVFSCAPTPTPTPTPTPPPSPRRKVVRTRKRGRKPRAPPLVTTGDDTHKWRKVGEKSSGLVYYKCQLCFVRKKIMKKKTVLFKQVGTQEYQPGLPLCFGSPSRRKLPPASRRSPRED